MDIKFMLPIILGEALVLCLVVIFILALQLFKQRNMAKKLKALASNGDGASDGGFAASGEAYGQLIDQHIESTRSYYQALPGSTEISLDIDADAPLARRAAALRHVILIAEKECFGGPGKEYWELLTMRYQSLFAFHRDFPPSEPDQSQIQELEDALEASQKLACKAEKFRQIHVDIEKSWKESNEKADQLYSKLGSIELTGESEQLYYKDTLKKYRSVFSNFGKLISSINDQTNDS